MSDLLRDPARLDALVRSELMDSEPEEVFDRLTRLATKLLGTPVATMTLVDDRRQFFKSSVGTDVNETPLSHSLCKHVVTDGAPLVVTDARNDPRMKDNGAVEDLDVIAYCGVPLTDAEGQTLGSFCAIEHKPREWTEIEIEILTELAHNIMTELDLRAANRALIAREKETRAIIESAHDAFIAVDSDHLIVDWNPAAELLFGWRAGEVIGTYVSDSILPDLKTGYGLERHASGAADMPSLPVEVAARHRNGRDLPVEVSVARVETPDGPRYNALIRDIAERRAAQLQREQLARVVESTRDAVITVDVDGIITSWNSGAERLYGYPADQMVGMPQAGPAGAAQESDVNELMPRLMAGEHVIERARPRRHRNGSRIYVDLSAAPLRDEDGTVIGATSIARDVTDQHRLEVDLERSEARFRDTFDEAPIGVALVGPNGRWLEVNRAMCEILGYREAELLERSFQDLTHPDDLDADLKNHSRILTGEIQTYQMEKRYFHKRGHTIWVKLSVSLVRDEHGTPLHFVSHVEDITRAKATESALREGRRLLDESQSVAGVGSWAWNLENGEAAWSTQMYLLHSVSPLAEAPSLQGGFLDLVHPDDRQRVRDTIFEIVGKRQPFVDEYRVALAGGRTRTLSVRGDYLAADPVLGLPPRIAGTAQDVTAERAARIAREETENRQQILLSSLPDTMVVLYDRDLRCTFVEGALAKELSMPVASYEGKVLSEYISPERLATLEPAIRRALTGESGSFEYTASDGRAYAVDIAPYRSEDRSITGAFSVWRDISQRRRMDDELRASREKALEASRLKSEFVANMSHEIRTPLNGVVSMAELLLDTQLSGEQAQYAQVAMTSAEALMRVINDILDFSKIEAGKLEIVNEDFSVRAAVDDVAEIVGIKAAERSLALEVAVADEVAPVLHGDGNRVRQVLMNLLSNAVKFTSEGQVTVSVALADDEAVRFEVADTGIGIDTEKLAALFEPFSQADATTTRRYGGTGLGLCISKQLVELMGGEIGCSSEPGVGSRFWFTLPYKPGEGLESDLLGSDLTGARVLVVDGAEADRATLGRTLSSWGIHPETAADGAGAITLLREAAEAGRPFETALIASHLPDTDGLALVGRITDVPALRATRLIMVVASPEESAEADEAGVDAQVAKPIRPSRLYNQLLATLHRARASQAIATAPAAPSAAGAGTETGFRVLVAEDNEINQFAAIRLLRTFGLTVDVANNGREAITMTGDTEYTAVFMDCQMPDVDGYTATRVIRRREEQTGRRTPIIALTAHALDGDREKCLAAGMDDYLSKPLRRAMVQDVLGRLGELAPAPEAPAEDACDIFDPAPLHEIGDPETEVALATMFLDQTADRLPAMREAIDAGDAGRLHGLAHGLKGSAATVGATRMSEIAKELCEIAAAGRTSGAQELHRDLSDALTQTRAALDVHITRAAD